MELYQIMWILHQSNANMKMTQLAVMNCAVYGVLFKNLMANNALNVQNNIKMILRVYSCVTYMINLK